MSYAVIRTGGKQHRVQMGDRLKIDRLQGDVGSECVLNEVLMLSTEAGLKVGAPIVEGAKVTAQVVDQGRGRKIRVFKRRRRKGFHKTIGHRQSYTEIVITGIVG